MTNIREKKKKKTSKDCGIKVAVKEKATLRVTAAEGSGGGYVSVPNSGSVLS